jgi:hypothetical protein
MVPPFEFAETTPTHRNRRNTMLIRRIPFFLLRKYKKFFGSFIFFLPFTPGKDVLVVRIFPTSYETIT